jgi:hypothetical protein
MSVRDKYLRKHYQITEAVYQKMLAEGGGACWICGKKPKPGVNLNVDHCHATGKVRGLLDFLCNKKLIGRSRVEHAYKYRKAAEYLENQKDWRDDELNTAQRVETPIPKKDRKSKYRKIRAHKKRASC